MISPLFTIRVVALAVGFATLRGGWAQTVPTILIDPAKIAAAGRHPTFGIGVAVWDEHMTDRVIPGLIRDAGFQVIRYPGGSYSDLYHWKTHSSTRGYEATIRPANGFDGFMKIAQAAKTDVLITVNYGSNPDGTGGADPQEAADWVRYANRDHRYGVKYWEIGNEVYGNGFYNGKGWELDLHAPLSANPADILKNPKLGPQMYGEQVAAFSKAMKAIDPTIKVGAVMTTPGGWPDGEAPRWNPTVLKACGSNIDFVVIHWYGEGRTAEAGLRSLQVVPELVHQMRRLVDTYCGTRAKNIKIWMTEGDMSGFNSQPVSALFAADHFLTWFESGADHVNWWNLHNGLHVENGKADDQGILSSGHSEGGFTQPPVNTPFPAYYGVKMASSLFGPRGAKLLAVSSPDDHVRVHAMVRADGQLGVMLINQDPEKMHSIRLEVPVAASVTVSQLIAGSATIAKRQRPWDAGKPLELPPYSVTTLLFPRS